MRAVGWKGGSHVARWYEGFRVVLALAWARAQRVGTTIHPRALALFTRQFSVMIDAGLPLLQCLEILTSQQDHKGFRRVLESVREAVEEGASLQAALSHHPNTFDDLYVHMVGAGEMGGVLDIILQRLSIHLEKSVKLTAKAKGALLYPGVVLGFAVVVVGFIMVKVIPVFTTLFEGAGAKLPFLTQVCIAASNGMVRHGWILILGLGAGLLFLRNYRQSPRGRLVLDAFLLKVPIFGTIFQKLEVARFCRTLGTLTSSGVPILEGMGITARTAQNRVIQHAVLRCRDAVEQGRTISAPLGEAKVFPVMVVQMVAVGEATGALDAMLGKVADYYEDEVDNAVANLAALLEPVLIILMGLIIGIIVVAMYLPIFNLAEVFGKE